MRRVYQKIEIKKFIRVLYIILEDPLKKEIIQWDQMGTQFMILNLELLMEQMRKHQFRLKNAATIVRQLNHYQFTRTKCSKISIYSHQLFQSGHKENLPRLKRITRKEKQKKLATLQNQKNQSQLIIQQSTQFTSVENSIKTNGYNTFSSKIEEKIIELQILENYKKIDNNKNQITINNKQQQQQINLLKNHSNLLITDNKSIYSYIQNYQQDYNFFTSIS